MPKPTQTATALKCKASNTVMPKKKQKNRTRDTICTSSTESMSCTSSQATVINLDSEEVVETEEVMEIEDAEEDPEAELGRVTVLPVKTC